MNWNFLKIALNFSKIKNSNVCITVPAMFWLGNPCYMSPTCVAVLVVWIGYIEMQHPVLHYIVCVSESSRWKWYREQKKADIKLYIWFTLCRYEKSGWFASSFEVNIHYPSYNFLQRYFWKIWGDYSVPNYLWNIKQIVHKILFFFFSFWK